MVRAMLNIPHYLQEDDYLQIPIIKRFVKENGIQSQDTKADYINSITEFANKNEQNEQLVEKWLVKIAKEGTKEICYKKVHNIPEIYKNVDILRNKIMEIFPNCPNKNIVNYNNTEISTMIGYEIISENGDASRIIFTYSSFFLKGKTGEWGDVTIYPVYIEVYLKEGFVVSRAKAKSTLYKYDDDNRYLIPDNRIDTMGLAMELIDEIIDKLGIESEHSPICEQNAVEQMLFNLYRHYSFTPSDVEESVNSQEQTIETFINSLFSNLGLDIANKPNALIDAKILAEKYISINGDNEEIFKKDRQAYLIKITSDDDLALTKIDTSSQRMIPLQCTEAFFDSKKSVVSSKKCKRLNLVFKREENKYFPASNQLVVHLGVTNCHGYIKTMQYAEEADIQNVLQAVFENY